MTDTPRQSHVVIVRHEDGSVTVEKAENIHIVYNPLVGEKRAVADSEITEYLKSIGATPAE